MSLFESYTKCKIEQQLGSQKAWTQSTAYWIAHCDFGQISFFYPQIGIRIVTHIAFYEDYYNNAWLLQ